MMSSSKTQNYFYCTCTVNIYNNILTGSNNNKDESDSQQSTAK